MTSPVQFEGSDISREHFALLSRQDSIYVQDLSSNGTFINGTPAPQSRPRKLNLGDVIVVAGYEIELGKHRSWVHLSQPAEPTPATAPRTERMLSLTMWELIVVAAAIGTFILIAYYAIG